MKKRFSSSAIKALIIYLISGGIWIYIFDQLLPAHILNPTFLSTIRRYEDWVFIFASSVFFGVALYQVLKSRKTAEQSYQNIIKYAVDGIFQSTLDGHFLSVNPAMARLYGYDSAEEMTEQVKDIERQLYTDPESRHNFINHLLSNDSVEEFENLGRRKDGTIFWISVSARIVKDKNGNPVYIEGFISDITRRKDAEAALLEAESQYRALVEQVPAAVYTDAPENNLNTGVYISPQIEAITGYSAEEWTKTNAFWPNRIHPDDLQSYIAENDRTNKTKEPFDLEYRIITKDNRIIWIRDLSKLTYDENGRPLYWQGILLDITDKKLTEKRIEESEEQYRQLVEHSPYAIAVHSNGMLMYLNQAGAKLIGATRAQELYGTPIINFVHPDSRARVDKYLQELSAEKEVSPLEEKFVRLDGTTVNVEVTAYPFIYLGQPAVQLAIRDLTEQKQAEQARLASEERFSKAFHASPIPTCITRLEDGHFVDVNEAYLILSKWERDQVIGRSLQELGIKKISDRELFLTKLLNREIVQGEDYKFFNSAGETLDVTAFYEVIEVGDQTCILSMFYDMTAQKQAQETSRSNEEKLRAIIDNTQNIYYSHTANHINTYVSEQIRNILGIEPGEALVNWKELITDHPVNQRGIVLTQKAIDTGEPQEPYVLELKAKDGRGVWVEVRETPIVHDGKTVSIVGALTDITERKEAEERMERQLAELTVIYAVSMAGSQSDNEDDVIEKTTQIIGGMLYPDNCGIILLNPDGTVLKPHYSYRGAPLASLDEGYPLSKGISGKVAASGHSIRIGDISTDPTYIKTTTGIHSELCVPIRVKEKIIGVLNAESRKSNAFDEEDERLMNTVAGVLGTSIERIRLFKAEQKQRLNAENLREATAALTITLKLPDLYENILTALEKIVKYDSATIILEKDNQMEIIAERGFPNGVHVIGRKLPASGKWEDIRSSQRTMILEDAQTDTKFQSWAETSYIHGWMGIPMIFEDNVIGFINADSRRVNAYTAEDAALAQTFANQAAIAIKNAFLYKSEQRRHQEAEKLRQAATAVTSSLNLREVLGLLLSALKDVVPFDSASILMPEGQNVRIVAAQGFPEELHIIDSVYPAKNHLLQQILDTGQSLILEDAQQDSRFEKWNSTEVIHGWMGIPMIARGQVIGFITLDSFSPATFTPGAAELTQSFAHQASVAIENARLFESLQKTNIDLSQAYDTTLEGWGKALELRDKETQGHTLRVTNLTLKLAHLMGCTPDQLVQIRRGTLVHDIGKMGVPDQILHKKGPLTKKEWEEMRRHPQHAFDLLYPIAYLRPALDIAYCHHEWWDGSGYPRGLRETQIPLAARIFAVVDVWDALLYERPYRKGWSKKKIIKYIQEQAGTHFDPEVVKVFIQMIQDEPTKK